MKGYDKQSRIRSPIKIKVQFQVYAIEPTFQYSTSSFAPKLMFSTLPFVSHHRSHPHVASENIIVHPIGDSVSTITDIPSMAGKML